ncbi:hypothetical protein SLA_7230 [Streptomyces laurentii]|uniref:Uncharacterized protein n=1 Tax=Streptomyces laurentii TaxID=39478 RepID=A0A160P9F0_STRLU|nr:hypothetical protein SLA_7230 [Streptomyces laurentii]
MKTCRRETRPTCGRTPPSDRTQEPARRQLTRRGRLAPSSRPAGLRPDDAKEHWRECLGRLHQALSGTGLALRSRARFWHPETVDFLVYRAASPFSTSE